MSQKEEKDRRPEFVRLIDKACADIMRAVDKHIPLYKGQGRLYSEITNLLVNCVTIYKRNQKEEAMAKINEAMQGEEK